MQHPPRRRRIAAKPPGPHHSALAPANPARSNAQRPAPRQPYAASALAPVGPEPLQASPLARDVDTACSTRVASLGRRRRWHHTGISSTVRHGRVPDIFILKARFHFQEYEIPGVLPTSPTQFSGSNFTCSSSGFGRNDDQGPAAGIRTVKRIGNRVAKYIKSSIFKR